MQQMTPIYQTYLDAVKGQQQVELEKTELVLNKVRTAQEIINVQNQIQERKAISDAYAQQSQSQQTPTNPVTGQPATSQAERTASMYDQIAANLGRFNPKLALEYSSKASTLRNQALGAQEKQLTIAKNQMEMVGQIFGAIKPGDQEGYTAALSNLPPGVDLTKLQLSGNVMQDYPQLQKLAQQSLTQNQRLEEGHRQVTENQAFLTYTEKVRHDQTDEGLRGAGLNLQSQHLQLDKEYKAADLNFKARSDARAAAGVDRKDDNDLARAQNYAGKPIKADSDYVKAVIDADPTLSKLPDNQKKAVTQELILGARGALQASVKKPGQTVSADDFAREVSKLVPLTIKRTTPGTSGWLGTGIGEKKASNNPLPPAMNSKADIEQLPINSQFRVGNKIYKKTSATDAEEIK